MIPNLVLRRNAEARTTVIIKITTTSCTLLIANSEFRAKQSKAAHLRPMVLPVSIYMYPDNFSTVVSQG